MLSLSIFHYGYIFGVHHKVHHHANAQVGPKKDIQLHLVKSNPATEMFLYRFGHWDVRYNDNSG